MKQVKSIDEVPCSHQVESTCGVRLEEFDFEPFRVETKTTCDRGYITAERAAGF